MLAVLFIGARMRTLQMVPVARNMGAELLLYVHLGCPCAGSHLHCSDAHIVPLCRELGDSMRNGVHGRSKDLGSVLTASRHIIMFYI